MDNQEVRRLDLMELVEKCRPCTSAEALEKVREEMTGGGCTYFGVLREERKFQIVMAEVTDEEDLVQLRTHISFLRLDVMCGLPTKGLGLSPEQVLAVAYTGWGYVAQVDGTGKLEMLCYCPREGNPHTTRLMYKVPIKPADLGLS